MRKHHLYLTTAILGTFITAASPTAFAQAVAAPGAMSGQNPPGPTQPTNVAEVIITATKSSQSIQKVAAAVTAVSGQTIVERGITNLAGVQNLVPSVRFQYENDIAQTFIRGIGSDFDGPWVPESVATNFNGMNLPRHLTGTAIYDIASVEVLPGPQGTLYGRAAIGGVVNINANQPTFHPSADAVLSAGNYGDVTGTFVGNGPLTDTFAVRAAINFDRNDGYDNNGAYSTNSFAARVGGLWKPVDNLSVYVWGSYYQNNPHVGPIAYFPAQKNDPFTFPQNDPSSAPYYPPNGVSNDDSYGHYQAESTGAEIKATLGPVDLTYIPTYAHYDGRDNRVIGGFIQSVDPITLDQVTQELRISNSTPSKIQYVGGIYWSHNNTTEDYVFGPFFGGGNFPTVMESTAVYGQATYSVLDNLRLTAGGRWSSDQTTADNAQAIYPIFNPMTFGFDEGLVPFSFNHTWTHFDWKVGFEADVGKNSMLYGNVQTGFNPGSYDSNPTPLTPDRVIKPQEVMAYTFGLKNRFFDRRLVVNFESFYYDYTDLILQKYNAATGDITIYNAPRSTIYGGEVDASYVLTSQDKIYANIGITRSVLGHFVLDGVDYSGFTLPSAPLATASIGYQHILNLNNGSTLTFDVDSYINSGFWALFDHPAGSEQGAYTKTDLAVTFAPPSHRWDIGIWVKNAENSYVIASAGETAQPFPRSVVAYVEPPRTFGVRLHVKFGQ